MFTVYILYSTSFGKTYTGQTNNFAKRILEHNEISQSGYTKKYRPWVVVHLEEYSTRADAMKREKHLKTWEGRIWIKSVVEEFLRTKS